MKRTCEVCSSLLAMGYSSVAGTSRIRRVLIEDRIVGLCEEHAGVLEEGGIETMEELRKHFVEPDGKRSLLPRRTAWDRRVFPPRPEGRRLGTGRRERERAQ